MALGMSLWRRRRAPASARRRERYDAPSKDEHVHRSSEEQIIERLRRMELPKPPPGAKERAMRRYQEWLREQDQQGRQPWRD